MRPASRTRTFRVFKPLLRQCLTDHGVGVAVAWFYMPLALPLLDTVPARAVVYDCMDELSAFDFAPPQLLQREAERLQRADFVLTATAGVLVHLYGPHIFHTNTADIFENLSRFAKWRRYQHHVLANADGQHDAARLCASAPPHQRTIAPAHQRTSAPADFRRGKFCGSDCRIARRRSCGPSIMGTPPARR